MSDRLANSSHPRRGAVEYESGPKHSYTSPFEAPSESEEDRNDRARVALQKLRQARAERSEPTQGQIVTGYKQFLIEEVQRGIPISELMDVLASLGEPIKVEGFRAALRNQLGTVKQIRQQKMTEPSRRDEPKRMSAFIHPAHRGEG